MTQNEMNILVPKKLSEIEREKRVTILYAAESGSRAWGFESPDSDFDVRFIYMRPKNEYLKLNEARDVIEFPINDTWDICGWDLAKALCLLRKSNPTLFEWLASPIRYRDCGFSDRIRPLLAEYFSPSRMLYHYLSMCRDNTRNYLQGESVNMKRYLYILRPVLACLWVMEYDSPPPMLFTTLAEKLLPQNLMPSVKNILARKMKSSEKSDIPRMHDIEAFINDSVIRIQAHIDTLKDSPKTWDSLNEFFIREISS